MIKKTNLMKEFMAKILIYGGGKAAKSVIELLYGDKNIEIAALVSRNTLREGVQYAKELNIICLDSIQEALDNNLDFNIIFNLTGEPFYRRKKHILNSGRRCFFYRVLKVYLI